MKGNRSKENCYAWVSLESDYHVTGSSKMKEEIGKKIRMSHYKLPLLAFLKTLTQHQNELIESIKVAINILHLDGRKDVERDDAASSSQMKSHCGLLEEPKNVREAPNTEGWIEAMQEELIQLKRSEVWTLVPRPEGICAIETKWVFKIKSEEDRAIFRKQARLVVHGDTQGKILNLDKTSASTAKLEAIRLLIRNCLCSQIKVFHMKNCLQEEIYVE
jgi:hypothetical protein